MLSRLKDTLLLVSDTATARATLRNIFQDSQIWEKIEMLKHHSDILPVTVQRAVAVSDLFAVKKYFSGSRFFQLVYAPQKGTFPGT